MEERVGPKSLGTDAFNRLISAVEAGEVVAIEKDGETVAIMIQPKLLADLQEEMISSSINADLSQGQVTRNIFKEGNVNP